MAKITQIYLPRLTNGAHFSFIESILNRAKKEAALTSKAAATVSGLEAAFAIENECLQLSRKSFKSDDIAQADRERDTLYAAYKKTVQSYLAVSNEERSAAARILNQHIKDYNIDIRMQMFRETGLLTNFIEDLEGRLAPQVEALGQTTLVADMKEANNRVKLSTHERVESQPAANLKARMLNARQASDTAYAELVDKVNALANVFGDADYLAFITYVNNEINEYRLKAMGQKPSTGGEGGTTGGTGDPDGGGTENPGGSGSGDTGSGDEGGGTENPGGDSGSGGSDFD